MATLALAVDIGFSGTKVASLNMTDRQISDSLLSAITTIYFPTLHAPMPDGDLTNISGVMDTGDGVMGLTGEDAVDLNPSLAAGIDTEAYYMTPTHHLLVRSAILRALRVQQIPVGKVTIHLSLAVPVMHEQYIMPMTEAFQGRVTLRDCDEWEWLVTVATCEVQMQPKWLALDALMRWDAASGILQPLDWTPLMGGKLLVIHDFGSLTYQGLGFQKNLAPVKRWGEAAGSWEVVRTPLRQAVQKRAADMGIKLYDPTTFELMNAYRDGAFYRGKKVIPLHDEISRLIAAKVEQRIQIADAELRGGVNVSDMLFAGGDAQRNIDAFRARYDDYITGECKLMTDEAGQPDPMWRLAHGALKGALRQWVLAQRKK